MICKFCSAEVEDGLTVCPVCGKEQIEETPVAEEVAEELLVEAAEEAAELPVEGEEAVEMLCEELAEETAEALTEELTEEVPAKRKPWKLALAIGGVVVLLAVLVGAVLYGTGVLGKSAMTSYTVAEEKVDKVRDVVVAKVGDVELTNNELQVYYWQNVNEYYNYYSYYMDGTGPDMSQPLDAQVYNAETGMTWQEFFLESALNTWSRYAALRMLAQDNGYQLSEDMTTYLESIPAYLDEMAVQYGYVDAADMLRKDMGPVCNQDGYMAFLRTNIYAGQYLDSIYDTLIPTQQEIDEYYAANEETLNQQGIVDDGSAVVDVRHILFCPQGGTEDENGTVTYSEAEWEECRVKAQELLDKWQAEDGSEEGFAQLAMEYSEDPGSRSEGGLYTDVYVGQMVEPFENWCFDTARKTGDSGLVQTNYGYHLMYFVNSEPVWIGEVRDSIINQRSNSLVEEAVAKWPMDVEMKKIALGTATAYVEE